jgi:hypothetical protein
MEREKIYIKPYDSEMYKSDKGFELHIFGRTAGGKGKEHEIIINFEVWWIGYLLKDFKRILNEKISYLKGYCDKINIE